jgi:hypothetical protein
LLLEPLWAETVLGDLPVKLACYESDLLLLAVEVMSAHAASYHRRVAVHCLKLPLALCWLAWRPAPEVCEGRRRIAKFIIDTPSGQLEVNAQKLRTLWPGDLRQAAATGRASPRLYTFAWTTRKMMRSDVKSNEGHNSLIKTIADRCRHISLGLLSVRANVKRELNVGTRGAHSRWSRLRDHAERMLEDSMDNYEKGVTEAGLFCLIW